MKNRFQLNIPIGRIIDMINLTIDGRNIEVPEGTTILQAAAKLNIDIPTLCYLKEINEIGDCRMCLV